MSCKFFMPELFKEEDGKISLVGCRCKACGAMSFPKNDICVSCLSEDLEEEVIHGQGELYSYTITRRPVDKWPVPHVIGMVMIPDQKLRIVAPLMIDLEKGEPQIGQKLEMVFTEYWQEDGESVIGYKFRPAEPEEVQQ